MGDIVIASLGIFQSLGHFVLSRLLLFLPTLVDISELLLRRAQLTGQVKMLGLQFFAPVRGSLGGFFDCWFDIDFRGVLVNQGNRLVIRPASLLMLNAMLFILHLLCFSVSGGVALAVLFLLD
jgi:hypothetical protein